MAYTVLARKYRSRTFDEVIGQGPIATTLVNAIKSERIHHGYLFTGTRGVGKTSMARILAKALNCSAFDAPTTTPCCECEACLAIAEGQDIDVVEIDAASNTGVDNIRELRSNAAYRPARSRFKVYIIDEVHMLSTGAFNALLKTLEEPPEHVKFILATTEIQKVPATIQSRCQRFNFRNIGPDVIAERLTSICKSEGAKADAAVVQRVARLANGSMRDALSILDQLLSVSPKKLAPEVLDEILPPAQDEQVFALLTAAAGSDVAAALKQIDDILSSGRGLEVFCNDCIDTVRTLMLLRACGPDASIVDFPAGNRDAYVQLSAEFELSQYVQMIGMLEELRRNVRFSSAGRALADAVVVRIARMREWSAIEDLIAGGATAEKKKSPPRAADADLTPPAARSAAVRDVIPVRDPVSAVMSPTSHEAVPASAAEARTDALSQLDPSEVPNVDAHGSFALDSDAAVGIAPDDQYDYDTPSPPAEDRTDHALVRGVSSEEREKILRDPVVQQTLDLFDGVITSMEIQERPQDEDAADESATE